MSKNKHVILLSAAVLAFGICGAAKAADYYTVTAFSNSLMANTTATSINANGQVVGWGWEAGTNRPWPQAFYFDGNSSGLMGRFYPMDNNDLGGVVGYESNYFNDPYFHAVAYSIGGTPSSVAMFVNGSSGSNAYGINNSGQVVGWGSSVSNSTAYLYQRGVGSWPVTWIYSSLTPGNLGATANSISNSGYITGSASLPGYYQRAYLYKDGAMVDLGTLGGLSSTGTGVNDLGQVVGSSSTETGSTHAFLYRDGQMIDIFPDATVSRAQGINIAGQVVGTAGELNRRGFLYSDGVTVYLDSLVDPAEGWRITDASDINDRGQIAATGCTATRCAALLLTPVPEPATALYLVAGLGLLAFRPKRRSS